MKLYVCMVMCGSICTLIYILFNRILPCELSLRWRRLILRLNIALYLMPFPWVVAEIRSILIELLEHTGLSLPHKYVGIGYYNTADAWNSLVVIDNGRIFYISGYERLIPFIVSGFAVCLAALAVWLVAYIIQSRKFKNNMTPLHTDNYYMGDDNPGKKVIVGISPYVSEAVAVGLINPTILLPVEYTEYEDAMEEVILHEINHVLCKDILERFFCYMVIVFHFYNPLSYYLYRECIMVSEMIGDETALKHKDKKKKAAYMRCMIAASQKANRINTVSPTLGVSKHLLKRRMERIMKTNNKKIWGRGMTVITVIVCVLASSMPAMAYQQPHTLMQTDQAIWHDNEISVFVPDGEVNPLTSKIENMDFGNEDIIFTDNEGNIYYCNDKQDGQEQAQSICSHNYVSGTGARHDKKSDGSCIVIIYAAMRCTKCSNMVKGEVISSYTCNPCPH